MKTKFVVLPLLFILSALPLFSQEYVLSGKLDRVVDRAGLLSPGEKGSLMTRLNSLSEQYKFDLVIVTENSIGDVSPMNYADDFFDYNGYGLGSGRDGCLFLIVTGTRDYWISTSGRGIDILNSTAFDKLESDTIKFLREDNYYAAINSFLDNWEKFLVLETKGRSYRFLERWNLVVVVIGWLIALITGFIVVQIWKRGMNTAFLQTQADSYVVNGSLAFDTKTDRFLYSLVTKTARPTEDRSSASSGRSHTSSSGSSHGGGGGKY